VSLLVSNKASLSLKFVGGWFSDVKYDDRTPLEIATIINSKKIRYILLIANWPKTHKLIPKHTKYSIEEILCCVSKNYNVPKELNTKIISTMLTDLWYS